MTDSILRRLPVALGAALLAHACTTDAPSAGVGATERSHRVHAATVTTEAVGRSLQAVGTVYASGQVELRPQVEGILAEAGKAGLLEQALRDRLVAIVGLSMAATPLLLAALTRFVATHPAPRPQRPFDEMHDDHPEVLIAGFGRFGQIIARLLTAQGVPFVGIEHSAEQVDFVRRFGNKIYYGDPARPDLLRAAGAARVKVFVVAIDDVPANLRTVRLIRRAYPEARVYARARDRRHAWQLMDMGVEAIRETFHSSLAMAEEVLVALGLPRDTAAERAARFREHDESVLRDQHLVHDDEDALMQSARAARRQLEQLFEADRGGGGAGEADGRKPAD